MHSTNGYESFHCYISCAVPQGTVLAPVILLVHIKDIFSLFMHFEISSFCSFAKYFALILVDL